jgi:hypothetical protein
LLKTMEQVALAHYGTTGLLLCTFQISHVLCALRCDGLTDYIGRMAQLLFSSFNACSIFVINTVFKLM